MSTSNYKLSPELLDAMIENDYNMKHNEVETYYMRAGSKSPNDHIHGFLQTLEMELSDPLKKIHSVWLSRSAKNCYPEKHVSDDFTNLEQINLCREKIRDNLLGNFFQEVHKRRAKDGYDYRN